MVKLVHNKRLFWIMIALVILLIAVLVLIQVKETKKKLNNNGECQQDSDCVKASCCHATSCVAKISAPDCSNILCTQVCEPGTLDCGGACKCTEGKCSGLVA